MGWLASPKCVHVLWSPEPVTVTLLERGSLQTQLTWQCWVKRSTWIITVGPKRKHKCPIRVRKRGGSMATKAEVTVMGQKPGTSGAPRGWGGKEQILPGLWRGGAAPPTPVSDKWSPELWKYKFLLFEVKKFVVICYRSPGKLIHEITIIRREVGHTTMRM